MYRVFFLLFAVVSVYGWNCITKPREQCCDGSTNDVTIMTPATLELIMRCVNCGIGGSAIVATNGTHNWQWCFGSEPFSRDVTPINRVCLSPASEYFTVVASATSDGSAVSVWCHLMAEDGIHGINYNVVNFV